MSNIRLVSAFLMASATLAACSSMPAQNAALDQARSDYVSAQNSATVTQLAPSELKDAGVALDQANAAFSARDNDEKVNRLAYLAKQKIATTEEIAKRRAAEAALVSAGKERDQLRLDQRTAEADKAKRDANTAQNAATVAQAQAIDAQNQAANSQAQAADAQRMTAAAEARSRQLEALLNDLAAKKTERGMVITLSDVLFNVDQAQLKPDGMRTVQKLADFMKQYPERSVMIEGYTDSTGGAAHNIDLSNRRADSVRAALESMGVSRDRVAIRGYGEAFPVAGNDTAGNRQLNRRVEIVLSDDSGKVIAR